jgi:hypothetical protein
MNLTLHPRARGLNRFALPQRVTASRSLRRDVARGERDARQEELHYGQLKIDDGTVFSRAI